MLLWKVDRGQCTVYVVSFFSMLPNFGPGLWRLREITDCDGVPGQPKSCECMYVPGIF